MTGRTTFAPRSAPTTMARPAGLLAVGLLLLAAGCQNPPPGATGGRVDPYRTTAADVVSPAASMPALLEFCDQTAESLARDLTDIPEIRGAPQKVVLELGSLNNKTRTPSNNFEMMQQRLRGQLLGSRLIRDNFLIVESRARMDAEGRRISGPDEPDLLDENLGGAARSAGYDPKVTYVLQGDFYESGRDNVRRYYFAFKLVNLHSRAIVFNQSYDLAQAGP